MKHNIKDKYKNKLSKAEHITNKILLKDFFIDNSIKNLIKNYLKHGRFYTIGKHDYGDYITENIVRVQMEKLQKRIVNKIILYNGQHYWKYVLEEDKED